MSLYDIAMGDGAQGARGAVFLGVLGAPCVARFRDAWVEKTPDGLVIAIYTRQGGGNRECYCEGDAAKHVPESCYAACNEALQAHPLYLRDADDDFDSTYATFYFRAPDEFRELLEGAAVDPVDMSARWQEMIAGIGTRELRPAEVAMADQISAALADPGDGPKIIRI